MRKPFVKFGAVLLAAVMLVSVAGCGAGTTPAATTTAATTTAATTAATTTAATTAAAASATTAAAPATTTTAVRAVEATTMESASSTDLAATGLPIVTEPLTLSMWATLSKSATALKTFADMLAYQELQKRTGITLEFLHPPVGGERDQFNLLVASRELPDLIEYSWSSVPGGPGAYIQDGIIIPLNEQVAQNGPNLTDVFERYPDARKGAEMDDGTYYMFPCIYGDPELQHAGGPIVRGDWIEQLGMELPETMDEWYALLTAVRDAEINGITGIIPFTAAGVGALHDTSIFAGAYGVTTKFYQVDGTIHYAPLEPEYKEYLTTMAKWYSEGLIDAEIFANTGKELDAKVMGDMAFAFTGSMGNEITRYTGTMRQSNPDFMLIPVYYPVINKGDQPIVGQRSNQATGGGTAITTACEHVVEAVKLLDYNFSEDGKLLGNFGVEGVTYNMVDGIPIYTDLILKDADGLDMASAISKYTFHSGNSALVKPNWVTNQRDSLPEQLEGRARWIATSNAIRVPALMPTLEESTEMATLMNAIDAYSDEMLANFVMGNQPIEETYEEYISTLKEMNIDRVIEIQQAQMDRYNARP